MSSTNVVSDSMSPSTPRPPSTSWQKPWVVAMVAESKSASAAASRSRRRATSVGAAGGEQLHDRVVLRRRARQRALEPLLRADQPLAHALAQLPGGHAREGHHQDLLQRDALGHVAGGERGDRERLAGARARLEHGHAGRERPADVEGLGHRCSTCSQASTSSHSRRA